MASERHSPGEAQLSRPEGETGAIIDDMTSGASPRHSRRALGTSQLLALAVAIVFVIGGMVIGFLSSFITLESAATRQHWTYPALLPLSVDLGILAYVLLDQLAITLGARSRWLHFVAWGLAAFTVWANATLAAASTPAWRVIHAAMPALWVVGVEALRFFWRRLHARPDAVSDRIPWRRWVLSFRPTFRLWRRMQLWGITSYPAAIDMELSRLHAGKQLADKFGPAWREKVPGALTWMLDDGVRMDDALAMVGELCAPPPAVFPAPVPGSRPAGKPRTGKAGTRGGKTRRDDMSIRETALDVLAKYARAGKEPSGAQLARECGGIDPSYGRLLKRQLWGSEALLMLTQQPMSGSGPDTGPILAVRDQA